MTERKVKPMPNYEKAEAILNDTKITDQQRHDAMMAIYNSLKEGEERYRVGQLFEMLYLNNPAIG